jgi:hypothetical protein
MSYSSSSTASGFDGATNTLPQEHLTRFAEYSGFQLRRFPHRGQAKLR